MKKCLIACCALAFAGCATMEISSPGAMKNGDRLLVIQNDGYELLWLIPLWSGMVEWDAAANDVATCPILFHNNSDTQHLYEAAKKIAERENCDLVDVTFVDDYSALDLRNFYGAVKVCDTTISAVLRPRK